MSLRLLFASLCLIVGLARCADPEDAPRRTLEVEIERGASPVQIELARREAVLIDLARQRGFPEADSSALLYVEMLRGSGDEGFDLSDPALRRRMIYWGEKILEERVDASLDEASLRAHLERSKDRFTLAERFDFTLVFLSRERRGEELLTDARALSLRLSQQTEQGTEKEEAYRLGDPRIGLSHRMNLSAKEIERRFGVALSGAFSDGRAVKDRWSAPIEAKDGVYLVYVFEVSPAKLPTFNALAPRLRASLLRELRASKREAELETLLGAYEIVLIPRPQKL